MEADFAISFCNVYHGFLLMRSLAVPIVGGVHGTLVGGGVAGCLHVDHLAADHASTFEHGNLVRGVCVLGMLSQTFADALGPHAQHVYLQNARLDATTALAAGLVQQLCWGITTAHMHAAEAAANGITAEAHEYRRNSRIQHRSSPQLAEVPATRDTE